MHNNSWIIFSILSALFLAIVSTVDKYVLTKWIKKPMVPVLILGVIGLIASIVICLIHGFSLLSPTNILLATASGISFIFMAYFYFHAAKIEEISRVVPLFYIAPLFVSILASIFLHEIFSLKKYLGVFFLLIGAVIISSKKSVKFRLGKAFWLMILSSFALSIHMVITKYLLRFADFWNIFSFIRIGIFLALIPAFPIYFPEILSTINEHGKKVITVMTLNESLALGASLLITIAASVGYVTLVNALSSVQPFFVLLFALVLSLFYPNILKEEIGKLTILLKFIAIILMFSGVIIIT